MDYSKLTAQDIELKATHNRFDEKRIKKAGFDNRMQRVQESIKKAGTEKEYNRLKKIEKQSYNLYKKYS